MKLVKHVDTDRHDQYANGTCSTSSRYTGLHLYEALTCTEGAAYGYMEWVVRETLRFRKVYVDRTIGTDEYT